MELRRVQVRTEIEERYVMNGTETIYPAKYAIGKFHCWENYKKGKYSRVRGIVELENGTVERFEIDDIQFINNHLEINNSDNYYLMT